MITLKKLIFILAFIFSSHVYAQLKVYKNDGTTVLGKNARCMVPPCTTNGVGWGYADTTTGNLTILTDTSYVTAYTTFFYSAADCAGGAYMWIGGASGVYTDGTLVMYTSGAGFGGACKASERTYNGGCVNTGSSCGWNYNSASVVTPACGVTPGGCKIK